MFYDETFDEFIIKLFKNYNSLNVLLVRDDITYDNIGRLQNLEESKLIDEDIKQQLITNEIPFVEFKVNNNTTTNIFNYLTQLINNAEI